MPHLLIPLCTHACPLPPFSTEPPPLLFFPSVSFWLQCGLLLGIVLTYALCKLNVKSCELLIRGALITRTENYEDLGTPSPCQHLSLTPHPFRHPVTPKYLLEFSTSLNLSTSRPVCVCVCVCVCFLFLFLFLSFFPSCFWMHDNSGKCVRQIPWRYWQNHRQHLVCQPCFLVLLWNTQLRPESFHHDTKKKTGP